MIALQRTPLILFGAFDRHNFGDLLFPHLMMALLPGQTFAFAGLAERDLTAFGGHRVRPLANWNAAQPAHLLHVGGELLTCSAWQAAVMLLDPAAAATASARYGKDPQAAARWAAGQLGAPRSPKRGSRPRCRPGRLSSARSRGDAGIECRSPGAAGECRASARRLLGKPGTVGRQRDGFAVSQASQGVLRNNLAIPQLPAP